LSEKRGQVEVVEDEKEEAYGVGVDDVGGRGLEKMR
jgi:hypothetical protein